MTRVIQFLLILFILLSLANCKNQSSHRSISGNDQFAESIDSLVRTYYNSERFSGSVLIADQGDIVFQKEYGYVKLDSSKLIDTNSVFEIASISKQFTAMLIMIMKEQGLLNYDDNLQRYFPQLPYQNITIRHLLTHTSGLSERAFFVWGAQNMPSTSIYDNRFILEEYLTKVQPELAFEPGTKWEYSNLGYFLLPLILEEVSGKSYINLLQEKIFDPLRMRHSGIYSQSHKGTEMPEYVFGKIFNPQDSAFGSAFGLAWSDSIYGGVGIVSNAEDLLAWDRALTSNALIDKQTLEEALTPYTLSDNSSSAYGFGWYVQNNYSLNGKRVGKRTDHNGLWPGYESSIVRYIDEGKTIIVLASQQPSAKDEIVHGISEILFK